MVGFKSFADGAEVDIESGLTGIVGPNGCGKSNIVEGLRWVMGESSARQMRGSEMDDVIFAGTDQRPARNLAEISLTIDNSQRKAPGEFNNADQIEVTRKIERGKGSSYYINARPARARDLQLLFADSSTGARSSGIVSQGRIGAIVGAKPGERRVLLEEAANIRGLHTRRHEAELRLRAAETNLQRLDDVIKGLEEQRNSLRKQSRQAARYRSVADRIRKAEAQLMLSRWNAAQRDMDTSQAQVDKARRESDERTGTAAKIATRRAERAAVLPDLRAAEVEQASQFQHLKITSDQLDREQDGITATTERVATVIERMRADTERESELLGDADSAIAGLTKETGQLDAEIDGAEPKRQQAQQQLQSVRADNEAAEGRLAEALGRVQSADASRKTIEARVAELQGRLAANARTLAGLGVKELEGAAKQAKSALAGAEAAAKKAEGDIEAAAARTGEAQSQLESAEAGRREAETLATKLETEVAALGALLKSEAGNDTPILDSLSVKADMERALTAYLGDDLSAPAKKGERAFWRKMDAAKGLAPPAGTRPLGEFVTGASELDATLAGVGVVSSAGEAEAMHSKLAPGQALATADGGLWRWDGFVRRPEARDAGAERIRQRQRLGNLETELAAATKASEKAMAAADKAQAVLAKARGEHENARHALEAAQGGLARARNDDEMTGFRLAAATERAGELRAAETSTTADLDAARGELALLGDNTALLKAQTEAHELAEKTRSRLAEAMSAESRLALSVSGARTRLDAGRQELERWRERRAGAAGRIDDIKKRLSEAEAERKGLEKMPDDIEKRRKALVGKLDKAEAERREASDALVAAETALAQAETEQRTAESELSTSREQLIRAEGERDRAGEARTQIKRQIGEKLGCEPGALAGLAKVDDPGELGDGDVLEERVQRLHRERDTLGAVNLRADVEMQEIDQRITEMKGESDDLVAAIVKLRGAISNLNSEGRKQLVDSFSTVNEHFQELFAMLFSGGKAELKLVDQKDPSVASKDPLEAGLEIMAQPPGKRLQSLSLLSGGEQALTALAIIFAVFLTNPAPICVLDEVDAPLDDTNVTRFCDLLRDICSKTDTRFLVVTHHRMTMARMDRLFGVTMEQRGVSKLVSVDLKTAEKIRDAAAA